MGTMAGGWINDLDDGVLLYWALNEKKTTQHTTHNWLKHKETSSYKRQKRREVGL